MQEVYQYNSAIQKKNPRGGWYIIESGTRLNGFNHKDLVYKLLRYREQRGIVSGNADQDVKAFIIKNNPHLGNRVRVTEKESEEPKEKPLKQQARDWMQEVTSKGYERVFPDTYDKRREVCLKCKFNNTNVRPEEGEGGKTYLYHLMNATKGKIDEKLGVCELYGHDNRLACWIKGFKVNDKEDKPVDCWLESE